MGHFLTPRYQIRIPLNPCRISPISVLLSWDVLILSLAVPVKSEWPIWPLYVPIVLILFLFEDDKIYVPIVPILSLFLVMT
jgi:hypothetical protein